MFSFYSATTARAEEGPRMETNQHPGEWMVGAGPEPDLAIEVAQSAAPHGDGDSSPMSASLDQSMTAASDVLEALARGEIGVDDAMRRLDELEI
jgi:hypothetical protein